MANVNWDRVVSCVAGVDGLEVVERDESGTLGAARNVPYSRQSPQRAPPQAQPVGYSISICTDAELKTYRFVKVPRQTNAGIEYMETPTPPFKACSDQDAWKILLYSVMDEAWCVRLNATEYCLWRTSTRTSTRRVGESHAAASARIARNVGVFGRERSEKS